MSVQRFGTEKKTSPPDHAGSSGTTPPARESDTSQRGFVELVRQVRVGDEGAAGELVRLYQPEIRRYIHFRLTDPRLRRFLDSLDICQSVLGNFFARMASGEFELRDPVQLRKLLLVMARNRLRDEVRRQRRGRRGGGRVHLADGEAVNTAADSQAGPASEVEVRELIDALRERLSDENRFLVDQRAAGRAWAEIASQLARSPEALRKQLARAVDRASHDLGLLEESHA